MSKTKFTNGPLSVISNTAGSWEVVFDVNGIPTSNRGDEYLCFSPVSASCDNENCTDGDTAKANAHLIAAAPELYELLEKIANEAGYYESRTGATVTWREKADQLLAKARGEK